MKKTVLNFLLLSAIISGLLIACKKEDSGTAPITNNTGESPKIIFKIQLDSTQVRLDNFGNPDTIAAGNSAQTPIFHQISAHYIELLPNNLTQLGAGEVLYLGEETTVGGDTAVKFDAINKVQNGETFYSVPISSLTPGTYEYLRISVTYQNYDIRYTYSGNDYLGRLASFVGYNTYITNLTIKDSTISLNQNKKQGYWAFESLGQVIQEQSPSTTVVNPLSTTSPIPPGSCIITGKFDQALQITGNETKDIIVTASFSTNNSFEWKDQNLNGKYEPANGDTVVDMGLRGMLPTYQIQ